MSALVYTINKQTLGRQRGTKGITFVYLAMGLDSTAYTLVAPAWTAKKDRIPEPQLTSRTT